MKIHRFEEKHLAAAGRIALRLWGDEVPEFPVRLRPLLYEYLAGYYFHEQSPFNFGVSDEQGLRGMLLAAAARPDGGHSHPADGWIEDRLHPEDRGLFEQYKAYLDGNRAKEIAAARPGEVALLFFASERPGGGRLLMTALEEACIRHGVPSMLLWTDETCDFQYYYKHGFEEVGRLPTEPGLLNMKLHTYLFRKHFNPAGLANRKNPAASGMADIG